MLHGSIYHEELNSFGFTSGSWVYVPESYLNALHWLRSSPLMAFELSTQSSLRSGAYVFFSSRTRLSKFLRKLRICAYIDSIGSPD